MSTKPKISASNPPSNILRAKELRQSEKSELICEYKAKNSILLPDRQLHRLCLASFFVPIAAQQLAQFVGAPLAVTKKGRLAISKGQVI